MVRPRKGTTCIRKRGGILQDRLSSFILVGNYILHHFNVEISYAMRMELRDSGKSSKAPFITAKQ